MVKRMADMEKQVREKMRGGNGPVEICTSSARKS